MLDDEVRLSCQHLHFEEAELCIYNVELVYNGSYCLVLLLAFVVGPGG
jgi:hypothetical protein